MDGGRRMHIAPCIEGTTATIVGARADLGNGVFFPIAAHSEWPPSVVGRECLADLIRSQLHKG